MIKCAAAAAADADDVMLCQMSIADDAVPREQPVPGGTLRDDSARCLRRHCRNSTRLTRHAKSVTDLKCREKCCRNETIM